LGVERARYEADRAQRRFDNVEPENRLVARTLETTLETKLTAVRAAENNLAARRARRPVTLTERELPWISTAGADVRAVFEAPTTTLRRRRQHLLDRATLAVERLELPPRRCSCPARGSHGLSSRPVCGNGCDAARPPCAIIRSSECPRTQWMRPGMA
jgi:hypothetical protein